MSKRVEIFSDNLESSIEKTIIKHPPQFKGLEQKAEVIFNRLFDPKTN